MLRWDMAFCELKVMFIQCGRRVWSESVAWGACVFRVCVKIAHVHHRQELCVLACQVFSNDQGLEGNIRL